MAEKILRHDLIHSKRESLERLACYLRLRFETSWSQRHLASLIYWRITRGPNNRR
jgi:hypothetical protein